MSEFVFDRLDYSFTEGSPRPARPESRAARGQRPSPSSAAEGAQDGHSGSRGRRAAAAGRVERGLGILLASLGLALLVAAAFAVVPPSLKVRRIVVAGETTMSEAELREAALVHGNEYLFSADTGAMERALRQCPRIASAKVERLFPDALRITVAERKPVAAVLVETEGRLEPVYLDAKGMAFAFASADKGGAGGLRADLPLLTGFKFEDFRLGTSLPPEYGPIFSSLAELEAKAPALLGAFSEIKVVKPAYGEPELLLYPLHHRLPVRTGAALNEATLRSIILVLDVLGSRGMENSVAEIDFRTGTVVYRIKEGQSG